jgi:single-strand selective monofunctional uracil DNA glycosylase
MSQALVDAAIALRRACDGLRFAPPVAHVYQPLDYAWDLHESWLRRYGAGTKRIVFLGMNPGPFGMVQTGVPFGEVAAVRDWLGIGGTVKPKPDQHPKRPVQGLACPRSEVSGRRLWGLFAERFATPAAFFAEHFVVNWCPLAFVLDSGRNHTPDQLPEREFAPLAAACDAHLRAVVAALRPQWLVGVGRFAAAGAERALAGVAGAPRIAAIAHPSPANPAANKGWSALATKEMQAQGVWMAG